MKMPCNRAGAFSGSGLYRKSSGFGLPESILALESRKMSDGDPFHGLIEVGEYANPLFAAPFAGVSNTRARPNCGSLLTNKARCDMGESILRFANSRTSVGDSLDLGKAVALHAAQFRC